MKKFAFLLLFSCSLIALDKPNIVIILTDDLGWGDVSYHGGTIPTPNIDNLVSRGLEMNRFYADPSCSPTRASMLTGINNFANGVVRLLLIQELNHSECRLSTKLCLNT